MHETQAWHHYHKRIRKHKKLETFPAPDPLKRFLDKIIFAVGIISPIMTIPQVWTIWVLQNASGVSVISWATYLFTGTIWLLYGIVHKEKPIIVTYILWIILYILIVSGAIIYG